METALPSRRLETLKLRGSYIDKGGGAPRRGLDGICVSMRVQSHTTPPHSLLIPQLPASNASDHDLHVNHSCDFRITTYCSHTRTSLHLLSPNTKLQPLPRPTMTAARKATRSTMGFLNLWTTDKGTFPVVIIAGIAATAAAFNASRYLLAHPDVRFDKERRVNSLHHRAEEGADWRARRFRFANYSRNPINQSRQFDDLFNKDQNKDVRR